MMSDISFTMDGFFSARFTSVKYSFPSGQADFSLRKNSSRNTYYVSGGTIGIGIAGSIYLNSEGEMTEEKEIFVMITEGEYEADGPASFLESKGIGNCITDVALSFNADNEPILTNTRETVKMILQ